MPPLPRPTSRSVYRGAVAHYARGPHTMPLPSQPRELRTGIGVATVWFAVQFLLLARNGIRTGGDTGRYLGAADALLRGAWPVDKATSYLGYDFFVALFRASGLDPTGIVVAQIALSGIATFCLYRLARRMYGARTGMLAALMFAAYPEIQTWNTYILTESLFVSMSIIALSLVVAARRPWHIAFAALALIFACTVRPHAVILLPAVLAYVAWRLWLARCYRWLTVLGLAVALAVPLALTVVGGMLAHETVLKHYIDGTIIWGYDTLRLHMPGALAPDVTAATNPIGQILAFAADKPVYFLQLAGLKLWYQFLQARPYYSASHNIFLVATLLPVYALALWGATRPVAHGGARLLLISVVVFQSLAVAVTFADWDGRHLLVILPFLFVFAAAGCQGILSMRRSGAAAPRA